MNSIFEKLGSYQILTNLLPGTFFGVVIKFFFGITLPNTNIGEDIVVYYFMGVIINRIGSLVVKPVLEKLHFIRYVDYSVFVEAEKIDSKINTLSEMNNYIRSLLTCALMFPLIGIFRVLSLHWVWFSVNWEWFAIVFLVLLFLFAYRKQTKCICERANVVTCKDISGENKKENIKK